jgi:hypothetical protein
VLGALAVLAIVGICVFVLRPRASRVTPENFKSIHEGMSRAEVEKILGPPGDYRTGPVASPGGEPLDLSQLSATVAVEGVLVENWVSDELWGQVNIEIENDTVILVSDPVPLVRKQQSPLDFLRWHAKRLWRDWSW